MRIAESIETIKQQMLEAAEQSHRSAKEIQLLAVSKGQSIAAISAAVAAGQCAFAENYLQEALEKIEALKGYSIEWHFIGAIQSKKSKELALHFDWVQTVCRLKEWMLLAQHRRADQVPLNVCIQVNVDNEKNKNGLLINEVEDFFKSLPVFNTVKIRGLMAIPNPLGDIGQSFQKMKALYDYLNQLGYQLDTLSMGMSGDFVQAIACGSTMVRVGTALFGKRKRRF